MNKKRIAGVIFGIAAMLLGMLWFLQGAGIVDVQPILCAADCEPITGGSLLWQVVGAVLFVVGAGIIGACARSAHRQIKRIIV